MCEAVGLLLRTSIFYSSVADDLKTQTLVLLSLSRKLERKRWQVLLTGA